MNLLERAEKRRLDTLRALDPDSQALRGQFFTPVQAAMFMADLPRLIEKGVLRILDPGAGSGILSAALVDRICKECPELRLSLTVVENDGELHASLCETLSDIKESYKVDTRLVAENFVSWALATEERFDLVIQNPPYAKLATKSEMQALLRNNGIVVPNIYAAFMALGVSLLSPCGQQVSITPRSWMNGSYYAPFRRWFTSVVGIDAIHTFESRSKVFGDTGVLQEAIIVSATKGSKPTDVAIYTSYDHTEKPSLRNVPCGDVITPDFIHVPATDMDARAVSWMHEHTSCTLKGLGLQVSTGRVVDFRSRENLRTSQVSTAVPLLHASHLMRGVIRHPVNPKKPEWFVADTEKTLKMLVPAGTYVLVKRFSSKEERRRIVAGVWESDSEAAFDNKVNFIHDAGGGFDPELAHGLCVFLNSTPLDTYFRVFSGHTQVNATDLRKLKFPTADQLRALASFEITDQVSIDSAVDEIVGK